MDAKIREEVIRRLVSDFSHGVAAGDWIEGIARRGFTGFETRSDAELALAYEDADLESYYEDDICGNALTEMADSVADGESP